MNPTVRPLHWFPGVLVLAALSTACTPTLYGPTQQSTPMLREAGELQATLSSRAVEAAYAVTPQVMVHAAGFYQNANEAEIQRLAGGWLGEAGAGMFGNVVHPDVRWSVLAGVGGGRTWWKAEGNNSQLAFESSALRGFVQPNAGWVTPYFEVLGSARISGVKYLSFSSSGFSPAQAEQDGFTEANVTGPVWLFLEPAVTVKAGYRWVKLFAQYQWAFKVSQDPLPYEDTGLTVGVALDLAQWHADWAF